MGPFRTIRVNLTALIALFVAVFGIFFQTLVPLAQTIPTYGEDGSLSGRIVICSGFGTKTIDLATGLEVPNDPENPGLPSGSVECLICLSAAIGGNAVNNTFATEPSQRSCQSVAYWVFPQDVHHSELQSGAHGVRAPPVA